MSKHHSHTPEAHDPADAWHQHTADEHPQQAHAETVAVGPLLIYGTAAFLIVVVATVATIVYFYWYVNQMRIVREEKFDLNPAGLQIAKIHEEAAALKTSADAAFKNYGWHDHARVQIPLKGEGGAAARVLAEYAARPQK
ncbi:MAG: hypothetical protein JNK35_08135 [Phycisphaerae bacterium]|nr:hypothetical protein [Phycisphaerae bacterium]